MGPSFADADAAAAPASVGLSAAAAARRHPEKRNQTPTALQPKPSWLRVPAPTSAGYRQTRAIVERAGLHTVCQEAACPNIGECWQKKHATFMILGKICTRGCAYCNVATGKPETLDPFEPYRIAGAIAAMELRHAVITSVDRDDLEDGGAHVFVETIQAVREKNPRTTLEVLTPDFRGNRQSIAAVIAACPDVFNHNLETVPRLYASIRPGGRYFSSLALLAQVKQEDASIFTKSGLMVGLGETHSEILQVLDDMRAADVDFVTIGQYLAPSPRHAPVEHFYTPEAFEQLASLARGKGFKMVSASPLTRSSYHADADFEKLRASALPDKG